MQILLDAPDVCAEVEQLDVQSVLSEHEDQLVGPYR